MVKDKSLILLQENLSLVTLQVMEASPITPWYDSKVGCALFVHSIHIRVGWHGLLTLEEPLNRLFVSPSCVHKTTKNGAMDELSTKSTPRINRNPKLIHLLSSMHSRIGFHGLSRLVMSLNRLFLSRSCVHSSTLNGVVD